MGFVRPVMPGSLLLSEIGERESEANERQAVVRDAAWGCSQSDQGAGPGAPSPGVTAEILCLNPQNAKAWGNKGMALDSLCKYQEALAAYEVSIVMDPWNAATWICKGISLRNLNRDEEALSAFEQALSQSQNSGCLDP